jgi:hypothetical protein
MRLDWDLILNMLFILAAVGMALKLILEPWP